MGSVFVGSTTGESHLRSNRGNEDAFFVGQGPQGLHCIVVCDGCGSSKNAATGAKATAELVGEALLRISRKLSIQGEGDWVIDEVIIELANCRNSLRKQFGANLIDYSATIVAAVHSPRGGFFLHIGDGLGISFKVEPSTNEVLALTTTAISPPENGEYANQTYYLSESNWIRHFRLTPIAEGDVVLIMTDGIQDHLAPDQTPNSKQLCDLLQRALRPSRNPNESLEEFLLSDDAKKQSNDDKTLVVLVNDAITRNVQNRAKLESGLELLPGNGSSAKRSGVATNQATVTNATNSPNDERTPRITGRQNSAEASTDSSKYISKVLSITSAVSAAIGIALGLGIGVATTYYHLNSDETVFVSPRSNASTEQSDPPPISSERTLQDHQERTPSQPDATPGIERH
jgi:serine/threonine protein phosphatase PrpC